MGPSEKIGRSVLSMVETIKDSASTKIVEAVSSGKITVDPKSMPALLALVSSTIDAGYQQAARVIDRDVSAALAEAAHAFAKKKTAQGR
jgi:hypothetical protein